MAALKNPRQERFAQAIALGKTADEAYQLAGYKPNRHNASRLKTNEHVTARIAAILGKGADAVSVTQEEIVRELARIGFSDLRKVLKWGPTRGKVGDDDVPGVTITDSDDLDDATAAAIAEVSQTKDGIRVKMHDKRAALVDLGRHKGMFKDDPAKAGDIHIHFGSDAKALL